MRKINRRGFELIKQYEGFRSEPYLCPAGVPTIGYGATYYPNGVAVTIFDKPITVTEAERLLLNMLTRYENGVERYVSNGDIDLNDNQFSALVSFAYNLGLGALKTSTLLKRVIENNTNPDIAYQFGRWTKAGGRELRGLVLRRADESDLYFSV